ncbi:MAG: ATP phosphoribosyltransferase, partial [Gemmatimonadaceae bacterium]
MIRIALPNKGRLALDARTLLTDAGLAPISLSDRALTARLGEDYEALFVRAQDIPEFVADGVVDAGVTGLDLVMEAQRPVAERMDLGFGRCRLVVAIREDMALADVREIAPGTRVATAFPRLAGRFFADLGVRVEIVPVSGAAEIAPHAGIAPVVVDLTSTGSTLRVNGLREVATILESTARLVVPAGGLAADPERREGVDMLA